MGEIRDMRQVELGLETLASYTGCSFVQLVIEEVEKFTSSQVKTQPGHIAPKDAKRLTEKTCPLRTTNSLQSVISSTLLRKETAHAAQSNQSKYGKFFTSPTSFGWGITCPNIRSNCLSTDSTTFPNAKELQNPKIENMSNFVDLMGSTEHASLSIHILNITKELMTKLP